MRDNSTRHKKMNQRKKHEMEKKKIHKNHEGW